MKLPARIGAIHQNHWYREFASTGVAAPAGAAASRNAVAVSQTSRTVFTRAPTSGGQGGPTIRLGSGLLGLEAERIRDAALELGGHLVAAPGRDHLAQLDLEVEAFRARRAPVQVPRDLPPPPDRDLTVQVVVHPVISVVAVHPSSSPRGVSGLGSGRRWLGQQATFTGKMPQPLLEL